MNTIHTICIVDDDEEIRSLLSDYLRRNGFSTCTAGNAAEFLEMQRRVPCSLIVMDIMLPGMNGLELFRTLRAESTVPVIFLTALGDITDRIVNIHPALLPKYGGKGMYGDRVHQAVVEAGEKESGITIHRVNSQYDSGDIIAQHRVPLAPDDTPQEVAAKVHALEYEYYPQAVEAELAKL